MNLPKSYEELRDLSGDDRQTIRQAVVREAEGRVRAKYGRYYTPALDKFEAEVQQEFLTLVNANLEEAPNFNQIAAVILDCRPYVSVAWAIAQRLRSKS